MPTVILPGDRKIITEVTTIPDIREMSEVRMEGTREMPKDLMEDIREIPEDLMEDTLVMPMVWTEETAPDRRENRIEVIFRRNRTEAAEEAAIWQSGSRGLRRREFFSAVWPEGRWQV